MKKILPLILLFVCIQTFAQTKILHTNSGQIDFYEEGKDWATMNIFITPQDISNASDTIYQYDANMKIKKFKFVSDIDSVELQCEAGILVPFAVKYKNHTLNWYIILENTIPNTLSTTQKLYYLSEFWSEVRYNFVFYDEMKFDWDSLYRTYIPIVLNSKNDFEYYVALKKFASTLKDGHTNISYNNLYKYSERINIDLGFFNDSLYVLGVPKSYNVPLGSVILEINDVAFDEYFNKNIYPYTDAKSHLTEQKIASSLVPNSIYTPDSLKIKYRSPAGKIGAKTFYYNEDDDSEFLSARKRRTHKSALNLDWLPDNIALLELNSFKDYDGQLIEKFENLKDTLYSASRIIIDLRENLGGMTNVGFHILQYLLKDSYFLPYGYQTRINNGVKRAIGNMREKYKDFLDLCAYETIYPDTIFIPDSIKRFDCKIVILTSEMTCSAAEDFLMTLYEIPNRPVIIGSQTFGSSGSPLMLWDWQQKDGYARVCTKRQIFPYSHKVFNEGIKPDIEVRESYNDYISGKDKTLEAAIETLKFHLMSNE